jgi:mannose-6-phosphate isomerase
VENKVLEPLLAKHYVSSGDVYYLPAGRVHAIGAGILLAEIQQTSDVTYRIYDFDRKDDKGKTRELHTELALEAIDFKTPDHYKANYKSLANKVVEVVKSPYFIINVLQADKRMECDYYNLDSFVTYICVEGKAELEYGEGLSETISMGETVLIPAELDHIKIIPESTVKILEVFLP